MSSDHGPAPAATPPDPERSLWLLELLDILEDRRQVLIAAAMGLSVIGIVAAVALPRFVPPRPLVGAAVGLASALLAVAIAVAVDAADPTVRGTRHVRVAGGQVVAVLGTDPTPAAATDLASRIDARSAVGGRHWVALAPAGRGLGSVAPWADALGVALAGRDRRVVVIDLTRPAVPDEPGVVEVVRDELKLGQAVDFDHDVLLARLGPGRDPQEALELLTGLVPRLPADIELLVVALPPLGRPGALAAAGALHRILVLAEAGATSRVELIAALDAIDAAGTASEVVLIDPEVPVDQLARYVAAGPAPATPATPAARAARAAPAAPEAPDAPAAPSAAAPSAAAPAAPAAPSAAAPPAPAPHPVPSPEPTPVPEPEPVPVPEPDPRPTPDPEPPPTPDPEPVPIPDPLPIPDPFPEPEPEPEPLSGPDPGPVATPPVEEPTPAEGPPPVQAAPPAEEPPPVQAAPPAEDARDEPEPETEPAVDHTIDLTDPVVGDRPEDPDVDDDPAEDDLAIVHATDELPPVPTDEVLAATSRPDEHRDDDRDDEDEVAEAVRVAAALQSLAHDHWDADADGR